MSGGLHLSEGFGVELEYMIVDRGTLSVLPVADEVLRGAAGSIVSEVELGELCWSNELVLHVIELKTNGPARSLASLPAFFQRDVERINGLLRPLDGRLMPTGMHPWMDPESETRLWPHEYSPVYGAFDRIFGCRGHGWSNLQSVHLNLPFQGDEEFGRLHAAIRLVLPLIPALAASTPVVGGAVTGLMDNRLEFYRGNARRVPAVSGRVVPERAFSQAEYMERILEPIYAAIAPHDPDGVLRHEWLNARGAIARFDRDTIEIRLLDSQECPLADVAACALVSAAVEALVSERWSSHEAQREWEEEPLEAILLSTIEDAESARIRDERYLEMFGLAGRGGRLAGEVWRHLSSLVEGGPFEDPLRIILEEGTLARRILRALEPAAGRPAMRRVYSDLCESLGQGRMFDPGGGSGTIRIPS